MKSLMSRLDSLIGGIVAVLMALALALSTLGILSRYFLADFNLDWIGDDEFPAAVGTVSVF